MADKLIAVIEAIARRSAIFTTKVSHRVKQEAERVLGELRELDAVRALALVPGDICARLVKEMMPTDADVRAVFGSIHVPDFELAGTLDRLLTTCPEILARLLKLADQLVKELALFSTRASIIEMLSLASSPPGITLVPTEQWRKLLVSSLQGDPDGLLASKVRTLLGSR